MDTIFKCPITGQEISREEIKRDSRDGVKINYYPVQVGGKNKYMVLCTHFMDQLDGYYNDSDLRTQVNKIKPILFYEFINDNLNKFGGTVFHWDCKNNIGKPGHIILQDLIEELETDNSYPKSRKQKTDYFLEYIKKNQVYEGGEIKIDNNPKFWGNLFFFSYEEMLYYIDGLVEKKHLNFNKERNSISLRYEGSEYIENELENPGIRESNTEYIPKDKFSNREKEILKEKLDILAEKLSRLEVGQQITYDDLMEEIKKLKDLLEVLGKKDWKQLLKGKLVDAGFGVLAEQVTNLIIDTFKDGKLLVG